MKKHIALLALVIVVVAGGALLLSRAADRAQATIDMTGKWNLDLLDKLSEPKDTCSWQITQTGTSLTGTETCLLAGGPHAVTGSINKSTGDFTLSGGFPFYPYSGNTNGSTAMGAWFQDEAIDGHGAFFATKKTPTATPTPTPTPISIDITGNWNLTLDAFIGPNPAGVDPSSCNADIIQHPDASWDATGGCGVLSGTIDTSTGVIPGISIPFPPPCGKITISVTAAVDSASMSGTYFNIGATCGGIVSGIRKFTFTPTPTGTPTSTFTPAGPTATPTVTATATKQLNPPGDTDGDGCLDGRENGLSEMTGGLRNYKNPYDFFDVDGNRKIQLLYDIIPVILAFGQGPNDPGGPGPNYSPAKDRGDQIGANSWNRAGPDGKIQLLKDIIPVILQYGHDCT